MYIKVMATPGAKKESVSGSAEVGFKISVKQPAEQNLANRRIIELVAAELHAPVHSVRILTGHHSRSKMLVVDK